MNGNNAVILKIASRFLEYPDEDLLLFLAPLAAEIAALPPGRAREVLAGFTAYLRSRPLLRLQEEYSRHFDLNAAASPHLTYHRCGDGRDRGAALVELLRLYHGAGYEPATRELPDYLPLVLEFLAICPPPDRTWLAREYRPQIEALADRLGKAGTPYGPLLAVVVANLGSDDTGGEE